MKNEHLFKGDFANILVQGGQIISARHDRNEWLYLVKVTDSYKSQLANDERRAKFVRIGEDNTIHGEYYCGLIDAKKHFNEWVNDNRLIHFTIEENKKL